MIWVSAKSFYLWGQRTQPSLWQTSVIHEDLKHWQQLKKLQIHTIHVPGLVLAETKASASFASSSLVDHFWKCMHG
jgi:hypothetical protein